jgi:hypothetical protein
MKKQFLILFASIALVAMVSTSCKKTSTCYCYGDVMSQGILYELNDVTKKECKEEGKKFGGFGNCTWDHIPSWVD